MSRHFIFLSMLVVAAACTEPPTAPVDRRFLAEPEDSEYQTIRGTVVSENELRSHEDGSTILLMGPQTELLAGLIGADISILGTADEFTALWVIEFRVLFVDGLPAFDGRLAGSEEGFAIEAVDGSLTYLQDVPDELAVHVGRRVWVTTYEGYCMRYGVLET